MIFIAFARDSPVFIYLFFYREIENLLLRISKVFFMRVGKGKSILVIVLQSICEWIGICKKSTHVCKINNYFITKLFMYAICTSVLVKINTSEEFYE